METEHNLTYADFSSDDLLNESRMFDGAERGRLHVLVAADALIVRRVRRGLGGLERAGVALDATLNAPVVPLARLLQAAR